MKRIFLSIMMLVLITCVPSSACTNLIVGKNASADGSVFCTYSADDYGMFIGLCHYPAGRHAKGAMRPVYDWDTHEYHGQIPEAEITYNVIGNINEYQVSIGETTFGGREEMVDTTGILDYGSLIYIALQRSKTAREAIKVMTTLAETYGFCSEGETFTICDPNEAWIMEMMGKGPGSKGVVWVALRIPDNAICAHANQSRIRTFNQKDRKNVMYSKDCINFAREKGWYNGSDKDFSFCETYAYPDFPGRRFCEARVWSFFNHFSSDMECYLPYAMGKDKDAEPMPLWIVPDKKVSLADIRECMRDHYEGTPLSLDNDPGKGVWNMPYRPTPLTYTVDGKKYFNERPISTQQSGFSYVAQLRSWLPRQIGGVLWFANDDGNMAPYTPVYCGNTIQPECYNTPGADALTFSDKNAYWVCNWVSNMVYPRYSQMFGSLKEVRDSLDNSYLNQQAEIELEALRLYSVSETNAVEYLNDYSCKKAQQMLDRWKQLAIYLIVKYNDMIIKPEENGKFLKTKTGIGARVIRPGYPDNVARDIISSTGDRYEVADY
ncbi:MAG: dipeptidase [Prevotella sp.]